MKIKFTNPIYALLAAGTILTIFIVFTDMNQPYSLAFVIGYIIFLLLAVLYFIVASLINLKKLKRRELTKRLNKFLAYFIVFSGSAYFADYILSLEFELINVVLISISVSFGLVFLKLPGRTN